MTRPTMADVAEVAGVGMKTVSRVVNGEGKVSAATRQRVEAAIAETGYRRNEIARSMRAGQRSMDIGLLLGDLTNPFFASVASAVIAVSRSWGYRVVLSSADEDPEAELAAIEALLGRQVAGLMVVPGAEDYSRLQTDVDRGTPVVFIDRPGGGLVADEVVIDNAAGARMAVRHLVSHGHERIGIVVAPSRWATAERLRGYREAMENELGGVDESLISILGHGSVVDAEDAARTLLALPDPPTAIFATTGFVTQGLVRALGSSHDTALVGFDDFPMADLLAVPITVVAGDPRELGTVAAQVLFDRIAGSRDEPSRRIVQPRLIIRGSGELPPRGRRR
ncbi:MAG TPA: LacI family DNA-binding transcriptional regulator [Cellulomonas sp.]|uniref:LacI family DNA-binding transcriptional regulator n=1 Tax=Cellulomonas sp. TaxID=40001 RepID=UPI002E317924|nr:LacI family DNA-binding transcriptional regulator [Cellulomonas sp.]HEX5332768.1 LacI family DNA-binding transcriptional regulator [Cellulomonas sp.]